MNEQQHHVSPPPSIALVILELRVPKEHREYAIGDLQERFEEKVRRTGLRAARRWFWRETAMACVARWQASPNADFSTSGDSLMQTLLNDLQYASKTLRSNPGFAGAVIVMLALAIGANTTIFSWINRALLDPLPGVDTTTLVALQQRSQFGTFSMSYPDYLDYRTRSTKVSVAGREEYAMNLGSAGDVERVWGELVSDNYFDVLGVRPVLGRGFVPEDAKAGESAVAVISHRLWLQKFGGDPSIVSRTTSINGRTYAIVGVTPPEFLGGAMGLRFDVWIPMSMVQFIVPGGNRLEMRGNHWFEVLARIQPGVSIEQARDEINSVNAQIAEIVPEYREVKVALIRLRESENGGMPLLRPVLMALMTVVALILVIACANIANLLLARATTRRREVAIRLSIGATRSRVVRQLLTEGLVLALGGAAGGLIITLFTASLLETFAPPADLPIALAVNLDYSVFAFTLGLTVAATVLFALAPALSLSAIRTSEAMKEGSAAAGSRDRLRNGLVVVQVALSLALLVSAGLCMRSLQNMREFNPGFDRDGMLLASLDLFPAGYDATTGRAALRRILDELQTIPGVKSYTLARHVPLGLSGLSSSSVEIDGYEVKAGELPLVSLTTVGPRYLETMSIPLARGRDFLLSDDATAARVAIITESTAARYWPAVDPLGGRFRFGSTGQWITVVGIARDMKWRQMNENDRPFVFLPVLQSFHPGTVIHVRTKGDPETLAAPVRDAVRRAAPGLPVFSTRTLAAHVSASTFQQQMASRLLGVFGALALMLSALGLYSVLAFVVGQRTREIGIRMALGARRREVFQMVVRRGLILTTTGVVIGAAAAYGSGQAMAAILFGVDPWDPITLAAGVSLLIVTAIVACLIPAIRATRVDPVTALRWE